MQRTLRIPSSVTPEAYFKVLSDELARRIFPRPCEADASFSTYSKALPSIESEYVTPSNICVSYNINDKPTLEQLLDGLPSEEKREIEKIYNSLSEGKRKELYDVLFYDKLITDVADSSRIKELRNKIYSSEIGKKSRKEVKRKIREEIERYLENNVKPIIEEYRKELLFRANGESDLTNVINEIFSPQNAGDYLRALEYIKKIGFHNFLEELMFENENPSFPVEYLQEAIASDAMADYLLRKGLYHISKDGALERASSYGEIFHKLSKQERKKVKEYEKKLGLRKSKAFAIGAASIILGAIGAAAYHAYKSGEKLKGDGSYFFHNPNDYIKYLKSIWNKHSNDIDNDRIPNDVEEKYGLDMFYAGDAGEDWNQNGFTNLYDYQLGLSPVEEYPKVFIDLLHKLSGNKQKAYCNEFVKNTNLTTEGLQQAEFLLSLSDEGFQQAVEEGLITNNNWDGDPFSNYFEKFIAKLDPRVRNNVYVILEDGFNWTNRIPAGMNYVSDEFEKTFNIPKSNVIKLIHKNATFENFKKACNKIANKSTMNDIVFIGMVGHGAKGVFCFNNGSSEEPYDAHTYEDIRKIIDKITAKRIAVVLTACYGNSSFEYFGRIDKPTCIIWGVLETLLDIFGGGEYIKYSWSGWYSPDKNKDGYISLKEAFELYRDYCKSHFNMKNNTFNDILDLNGISEYFYIGEARL